jgi:hypothetical protein
MDQVDAQLGLLHIGRQTPAGGDDEIEHPTQTKTRPAKTPRSQTQKARKEAPREPSQRPKKSQRRK